MRHKDTYRSQRKQIVKFLDGDWKRVPYQAWCPPKNLNTKDKKGFAMKFVLVF